MSGQEFQPSSLPDSSAHSPVAHDQRSPVLIAVLSALSVLVLLAVLATVALGIMIYGRRSDPSAMIVRTEPAEPDPNYVASGPKLTEFTLTERSGEAFNSRSLRGKVWVASFFYSSCPHKCLQLNQGVQQLEQEFGKQGVTFLSITCDPKNDTPQRLAKYADGFGADEEQWLFLTGDMDYIRRVGNDMFSAVVAEETHADRVYVVDKQGAVRSRFVVLDSFGFRSTRLLIKQLIDEPYEPQAAGDDSQSDATTSPPNRAAGVGEPAAPAESNGS